MSEKRRIHIYWEPDHMGIEGKVVADELAEKFMNEY